MEITHTTNHSQYYQNQRLSPEKLQALLLSINPLGEGVFLVFVVFPYLLNFCRQWHLWKFLILGYFSSHLFGLVFPCPTSKKMRRFLYKFLERNLKKYDKLYIFLQIYFMLKDHQKPHLGTRYRGNLISLFSSIDYL